MHGKDCSGYHNTRSPYSHKESGASQLLASNL